MKEFINLYYDEENALDIYIPEKASFSTIVFIHGGGIESGDKSDPNYKEFAEIFTSKGYGFVSINYSLYPNTKFPKFIHEVASAIKYVYENIEKYGGVKEIYVSGQSAGAYISMMLAVNPTYLLKVGVNPLSIKGFISDSGQMTSHFNILHYEKHLDPLLQRIDIDSPLYYVNKEIIFSKILLIYYENDMPNRMQQNELFYSSIKNFNPNADIVKVCLNGGHCNGSCNKNKNGEYDYINTVLNWIF